MSTVHQLLNSLGNLQDIEVSDPTILNLEVIYTSFPSKEAQNTGVFLVILTPEGGVQLRLVDKGRKKWLFELRKYMLVGGSRKQYAKQHGACPRRKLGLVRCKVSA